MRVGEASRASCAHACLFEEGIHRERDQQMYSEAV